MFTCKNCSQKCVLVFTFGVHRAQNNYNNLSSYLPDKFTAQIRTREERKRFIQEHWWQPVAKTHRILSCFAMPSIGSIVPRHSFMKGTIPNTATAKNYSSHFSKLATRHSQLIKITFQSCHRSSTYNLYHFSLISSHQNIELRLKSVISDFTIKQRILYYFWTVNNIIHTEKRDQPLTKMSKYKPSTTVTH